MGDEIVEGNSVRGLITSATHNPHAEVELQKERYVLFYVRFCNPQSACGSRKVEYNSVRIHKVSVIHNLHCRSGKEK